MKHHATLVFGDVCSERARLLSGHRARSEDWEARWRLAPGRRRGLPQRCRREQISFHWSSATAHHA